MAGLSEDLIKDLRLAFSFSRALITSGRHERAEREAYYFSGAAIPQSQKVLLTTQFETESDLYHPRHLHLRQS
jgi:hypothetical protein